LCALALSACGGEQPAAPAQDPTGPSAQVKHSQAAPSPRPSLLDAQGRLKSSGLKVDWFEIPAGFENKGSRPQRHYFVSHEVTMGQLREYLGARMLTGQVDELGEGAVYRAVMPLSASEKAMRFDVEVAAIDQDTGVSLMLDERTFLGAPPLSVQEAARVLAEEQAKAE
jgi:hypothetical protein